MNPPPQTSSPTSRLELLGWLFAILSVVYAYTVHQGIGPPPVHGELAWYDPRGFLHELDSFAWAFTTPSRVMALLMLPAGALVILVFISSRSALARTLSLACLIAVFLFGFYGTVGKRVWEFFFWRGSAVLTLTALIVSCALTAPLLARSWSRLGWTLRALTYLPICFAAIALLRNATGTDERLFFSLSPWPVVAIFGLEVGSLFVMVWLAGTALGAASLARHAHDRRTAFVGLACSVAVPVGLIALGAGFHLLPFQPGMGTFAGVALATALGIAWVSARNRLHADTLRDQARYFALGAALIAVPLVTGELWARIDYHWTRDVQAAAINEAMERYYAREDLYPDTLEELVSAGDMNSIPTPAIGFAFLYDGTFRYTSFGTSYLLAFTAPRWVECHYNSPFHGDLEEEELDPEDAAALEAVWSCPSTPPELW